MNKRCDIMEVRILLDKVIKRLKLNVKIEFNNENDELVLNDFVVIYEAEIKRKETRLLGTRTITKKYNGWQIGYIKTYPGSYWEPPETDLIDTDQDAITKEEVVAKVLKYLISNEINDALAFDSCI